MEETGKTTANVKYLNLSRFNMAFMKNLENYRQLEVLDLSRNHIEEISNIAFYQNLWKLDLSFNKVTCLDGLIPFIALGCLNLSHNQISWSELLKIRHIQILDLMLFGNTNLEKEKFYRIHLIDSLPNVWMLDGKMVTACEHLEIEHLFKKAEERGLALWHKLPRNKFFPSYLRHVQINGAFGKKACHLFMRFPQKTPLNSEIDRKKLKYLAYNMQGNLHLEFNSAEKLEIYENIFEELLESRQRNKEKNNILFLLLLVSLEFHLPTEVIVDMLALTSLHKYGNYLSIDLFLLPTAVRCLVVLLLLNAIKVDHEDNNDESIYDDLFLYVYNNVPDLLKLTDHRCRDQRRMVSDSSYKDYRSLLAAEISQILLLVPSFYQHIKLKDPGLISLLKEATNEKDVCSVISDVFNNDGDQQAKKEVEEEEEEEEEVEEEDTMDSKQSSLRLVLNSLIQRQLKLVTSKQLVLTPSEHLLNSMKREESFDNNGMSQQQKEGLQGQESEGISFQVTLHYSVIMNYRELGHLKYEKEHSGNTAHIRQEYRVSSAFEKEERRCLRSPLRSFSARTGKSKCSFYNTGKELVKQCSTEGSMYPTSIDEGLNSDDTQQENKIKIIVNVDSKYLPNTGHVELKSCNNLKYNSTDFDSKEELLILNVDQLSERKNIFPLQAGQFVCKPKKAIRNLAAGQRKMLNRRPASSACVRNFSELNILEGNSEKAILHQYLTMIANGVNSSENNNNNNNNNTQQQQQLKVASMQKCRQGLFCEYEIPPSDSENDVKADGERKCLLHLQSGRFWLAGGRNVFQEQRLVQQSLKNNYIPGWKHGMDNCKPKTASKKHSHGLINSVLRPSTATRL